PSSVAGVLAALEILEHEPERRTRLWENTFKIANGLRSLGFDLGDSETPIIPVVVGELIPTLQLWRALFDEGVFTHPIVPPAVPATSCRLRVSMSAEHSEEQVERVLSAFERASRRMSLHGVSSWAARRDSRPARDSRRSDPSFTTELESPGAQLPY